MTMMRRAETSAYPLQPTPGAEPLKHKLATFVRFLAVGVVNTVVGLGIIYFCKWALGAGDVIANVAGYSVGLLVSFTLNRSWTFRDDGAISSAFARFMMVFFVAYAVNLASVLALIRFGVNDYLAQALGVVPYTLLSFLAGRYFVFRSPPEKARP